MKACPPPELPKLALLKDGAGQDVPACMGFPAARRARLHSTNPITRPKGEIKGRTGAFGIFPDGHAITPPGAPAAQPLNPWHLSAFVRKWVPPDQFLPFHTPAVMHPAVPAA